MTLPRLYAIVDAGVAGTRGWAPRALAHACLEGGARLIQVRAKGLSSRDLLRLADDISHDIAGLPGATLVVNDRADIARLVGAGVHVGQDDLPPSLAREIVGAAASVGFSTHTAEQVDAALAEPISYLAVGPVFGTRTKDTGYGAVGVELVSYAAARTAERAQQTRRPPIPIVAIGGITLDTARSVIDAGASSVAVISDVLEGNDPAARVKALLDRLGSHP